MPALSATSGSTYHGVVLAAHHVRGARAAPDADDADGRAAQAQDDVEALHDDAEQAEERAAGGRVSLQYREAMSALKFCADAGEPAYALEGVAALDGAGIA